MGDDQRNRIPNNSFLKIIRIKRYSRMNFFFVPEQRDVNVNISRFYSRQGAHRESKVFEVHRSNGLSIVFFSLIFLYSVFISILSLDLYAVIDEKQKARSD
jgi:hypothetical protein